MPAGRRQRHERDRRNAADHDLAVRADVEQLGAKGDGDAKAGKGERDGTHDNLGETVLGAERVAQHRGIGGDRIVPAGQHEHAADR